MTEPQSPPAPLAVVPGIAAGAGALDLRSLAAFRVLLGGIVAADALFRAFRCADTLFPDGMLPPEAVRRFVGYPWSWSLALACDSPACGLAVLALEGAAGALLAFGCSTPFATTLSWLAVTSIVRRTAPVTNAGDVLLACLLFWGQFLPLGGVWSVDARRRGAPAGDRVVGIGAAALVLQVAAVYLSAGLGKCNEVWWSGDAGAYALSVHDHGTFLGDRIAGLAWPARVATWSTLLLELAGPLLLAVPRARTALVAVFVGFHLAIAACMDVCLFPWVGIAAWVALLPAAFWERGGRPPRGSVAAPRSRIATAACAAAMVVAAGAWIHANGPWRNRPAPRPLARAVQVTFLEQNWRVFGDIRRQRNWVYAEAELADGSRADLLRPGRPLERVLPEGGFHAIGDERLQKLLWELPKADRREFAAAVAGSLARAWNAGQPESRRVVSLELHGARRLDVLEAGTIQDVLLASWPPRSAGGRGALDRFLRDPPDPRSSP